MTQTDLEKRAVAIPSMGSGEEGHFEILIDPEIVLGGIIPRAIVE